MNFPLVYDLSTLCKSAKENLKPTSFEIVQLTDFMAFDFLFTQLLELWVDIVSENGRNIVQFVNSLCWS